MTVFDKGAITVVVCSLLFAALALPLARRRVPRNLWYGYRTRATLADDHLWREANACFGSWLFAGSLASAVLTLVVARHRLLAPESFLFFSVVALGAPVAVAGLRTTFRVRQLARRGS